MSDCFKVIEENIRNLRFSIEFDTYDLNYRQQNLLMRKIEEIEQMLEQIKENEVNV